MGEGIEANVEYVSNMRFVGAADSAHSVVMDTSAAGGEGTASRPMELLLVALGGCTGMDVVSILRKMRVTYDNFRIEIKGELNSEHPKVFKEVALVYRFRGRDLPQDRIEHAVELSQEKYCPVSATLRPTAKMSYRVEISDTDEVGQ